GRATPRQRRLAMPRRRSMACIASARGRHRALIQGLVAICSTAQEIQFASLAANRLMRRGARFAQAKTRVAGITRTATRAKTIATKASRRERGRIAAGFFAVLPRPALFPAVLSPTFAGMVLRRGRALLRPRHAGLKGG